MTCTKGSIDDFFIVKWIVPEVVDAEAIVGDVRKLSEDEGKPVRYIAIIGADVDPPGEDVRASMKQNIDALLQYCASVHIVIEGQGFRRAMARSIGTGIFLLSKNRGRTFAHDNVLQAVERAGVTGTRANALLARAREQGLLSPGA